MIDYVRKVLLVLNSRQGGMVARMRQTTEPVPPRPGHSREAGMLEPGRCGWSHAGHVGARHLTVAAAEQLRALQVSPRL